MTDREKTIAQGAFRAGWVAACTYVADQLAAHGGADLAPFFWEIAQHPAPVMIGDIDTPEGQALAAQQREILSVETIPAPAPAKGGERDDE